MLGGLIGILFLPIIKLDTVIEVEWEKIGCTICDFILELSYTNISLIQCSVSEAYLCLYCTL